MFRNYGFFDEDLPGIFERETIKASRYPAHPPEELWKLKRMINNQFVDCEADTIIFTRGPAVFGWNNGGFISPLFRNRKPGVFDIQLHEEVEVKRMFLSGMGVGNEAPTHLEDFYNIVKTYSPDYLHLYGYDEINEAAKNGGR